MRTGSAIATVLLVTMVSSACGLRVEPDSTRNLESSLNPVADATDEGLLPKAADEPEDRREPDPPPAGSDDEGEGEVEQSPSTPEHQSVPGESPEQHEPDAPPEPVSLKLDASPACARSGEQVEVTARTEPGMVVGMVVSYSDHQDHDDRGRFIADDEGVVVWLFTVGMGVPPGEATVVAVASTPDGERGSAAETTFDVAGPLGCR